MKRRSPVAKAPGAQTENRFNTSVNQMDKTMKEVYDSVIARDPNQPEFHQAVEEVLDSLSPVIKAHPEYLPVSILHHCFLHFFIKQSLPFSREAKGFEYSDGFLKIIELSN